MKGTLAGGLQGKTMPEVENKSAMSHTKTQQQKNCYTILIKVGLKQT